MKARKEFQPPDSRYSLEVMAQGIHYNEWIYDLMRPFLGTHILEFGAGIGNLTKNFLREGRRVMAIDVDEELLKLHRANVPASPRLTVSRISIQQLAEVREHNHAFDSVVSSNVLEHIPDGVHRDVLKSMARVLKEGGYAVHWVPAFNAIFGSLDTAFGHYRRYNRGTASRLFTEAGFEVVACQYWNMIGFWGWWFQGRVMKRTALRRSGVVLFDRFVVPLMRHIEPLLWRPFGQSLLIVARKP